MGFSYFFRDVEAMDLIIKYAIPEIRSNRYISIWSAGCSEGQEPYTLAIKLRETLGHFTFRRIKIYATDIDNTTKTFGETINQGIYQKTSVGRIDKEILSKYFNPIDGGYKYELIPEIKNAVEFQKHDLLSLKEIKQGINVILCKNVLMHFNQKQRIDVINMFHRALAENGFFAMERTQKMPDETKNLYEQVSQLGQLFRKR